MSRPSLEDLISFEEAEELIHQHDRYEYLGCDLQRLAVNGICRWFVYFRGKAIQVYDDPAAEPVGRDFEEAIEDAMVFSTRLEDGDISTETTTQSVHRPSSA